jgi:hypothetical protein
VAGRGRMTGRRSRHPGERGPTEDLMNKVTEARRAAETALITRRQETAAMRA